MHWFYLLVSFLLVFAAAAIADPDVVPKIAPSPSSDTKPSTPSEAKKLPAKSQPAASLPKTTERSQAELRDRSETYYEQCIKDWDAATHMTKKEWQRTCRRITDERTKFLLEQMDK